MRERARRCEFIKSDATRCGANSRRNKRFCFFHDPAAKSARNKARRSGGLERSHRRAVLALDASDLHLKNTNDVLELLSETGSQLRTGQLDPRIANGLFYLCSIALTALKQGPLQDQLDRIESVLESQQPTSGLQQLEFAKPQDEDLFDATQEDDSNPNEDLKANDDQN